jgi:hypothetical protein
VYSGHIAPTALLIAVAIVGVLLVVRQAGGTASSTRRWELPPGWRSTSRGSIRLSSGS